MGPVSRALPVRHRPRRGQRAAAVLAAAVLALSACSNAPMDRAATVNGQVISESELQEAVALLNASPLFEGQPVSPGQILGILVQLPVLEESIGGTLGDNEAASRAPQVLGIEEPTPLLLDLIRAVSYLQGGAQATPDQLAGLDVDINPRYGTWDPERAAVVPDLPDWISTDEVDS